MPLNKMNKTKSIGAAHTVMVIVVRNGHGKMSSILDEAVCISHSLGKGMNVILFPSAMSK